MTSLLEHFERSALRDIPLSTQVVVQSGASVRDVVLAMSEADTSCAFVMTRTAIAGIFTEHDVTHRVVRSPDVWDQPVDDHMTWDPSVINRNASAFTALQMMRKGGFRNLPVVLDASNYANVTHYDLISLASHFLSDRSESDDAFTAEHALRYVDFYGMPSKVPLEVTEDRSLFEVVQLMIDRDRGLVSVVDARGVVIGEFTQHDVFRKVACRVEDLNDEVVGDWMTEEFASTLPSATIADGLQEMAEKRHRYLVLTNETGRSVGVATFRDIGEFFEAAFEAHEVEMVD